MPKNCRLGAWFGNEEMGTSLFGDNMNKVFVAYIWILSLMGAVFLGNEIALSRINYDRDIANDKIENCNKIIAGSLYESK